MQVSGLPQEARKTKRLVLTVRDPYRYLATVWYGPLK
jgi:hypothetical protein